MQGTWIQSLGREDPLEKEMATYSSVLAWKIPWMEETGRLQARQLASPVEEARCKCWLVKNNVKHCPFNVKSYPVLNPTLICIYISLINITLFLTSIFPSIRVFSNMKIHIKKLEIITSNNF